jgi:alkylation response protein AidB-like acyl-CoA dehydrogenase
MQSQSELVQRAARAAATIATLGDDHETTRKLAPEAARALVDAGVYKLLVPRDFGGSEASPVEVARVLETIAAADGSAGWCAMIGATSGLMAGYLDPAAAREIFSPDGVTTCGVFAPMGRATAVDGGYRVSGRWPFASGCELSQWTMGGAMLIAEGDAQPKPISLLFKASELQVIDTWNTVGLRGTGSHDVQATDVFVPSERAFSFFQPPRHAARLYTIPFFGVLASTVSAVALGIARGAVDTFVALANAKQPRGSKRSIAHRELVQLHVAQAEAKIGAGRALLHQRLNELEREALNGKASLTTRAHLRIAASHAATEAAAAVDLVYNASGATSIYTSSPLQKHFRDVHVATQHLMVAPTALQLAGRVLLGLEADTTML